MANSLKRIILGQPLATSAEKARATWQDRGSGGIRLGRPFFGGLRHRGNHAGPRNGGTAAIAYSFPIMVGIVILVGIVAASYWQTVHAYPSGGGSYIVAKDNLGTLPGLIAGAALLIDYVLTVAVSTASGVAAITSAFPILYPWRVTICTLTVIAVTVANLRGLRESGRLFTIPTYWFIASLGLLMLAGLYRIATGTVQAYAPEEVKATEAVTVFLILRAFSSAARR